MFKKNEIVNVCMADNSQANSGQPQPSGLFGAPPKAQPADITQGANTQLSDFSRRLRMVEESLANTRRKLEIGEEGVLADQKKKNTDINALFTQIEGMRKELSQFKNEMQKMIKEFQTLAKKEEVQVLQKYIQLWEPVKFATVTQVERIVSEEIARAMPQTDEHKTPHRHIAPTLTPEPPRVDSTQNVSPSPRADIPKPNANSIFAKLDEIKSQPREQTFSRTVTQGTPGSDVFSEYTEEVTTTSHEDEATEPTVSPEQKTQIAKLIEEFDDIRELLITNPKGFAAKINADPKLNTLFRGVNIAELSEKLKKHYDSA